MSVIADHGTAVYQQALLPTEDVLMLREAVAMARFYSMSRAYASTSELKQQYGNQYQAQLKSIDQFVASYGRYQLTAAQRAHLDNFRQKWQEYTELLKQLDALIAAKQTTEADALRTGKVAPTATVALNELEQLRAGAAQAARERVASQDNANHNAKIVMVVVLVVGLLIAVLLTRMLSQSIVRPLGRVRTVLDAVADGDLTQDADVDGRDELGQMAQALRRATARVRALVTTLESSSEGLHHSAEHLQSSSEHLAEGVAQTSQQVAEISAATGEVNSRIHSVAGGAEEMGSSIREIARNATEAAGVAGEAVEVATNTERTMLRLGSSSSEIGHVVQVITTIAEQTNLLALNATIEAARAGESGKGFAVVAGEVKELAQETAKATSEIGQRISAIQADSASAMEAIAEMSHVISKINEFQSTIASAVEEQSATTGGMSAHLAEAADGSEQIADGIAQVTLVAERASASAASTNEAASKLRLMSDDLSRMIADFRH